MDDDDIDDDMDDDDDDDGDDDDGDDGVVVAAATGGSSGGSSRPTTTSSTAIVVAIVIVIRVSQLCRYAGCVRVDLLFFPFGGKDQHTGISTCGPKLACRRPGTKYCVDLFFYFRTLWNPPPLKLFFLLLALRPTFHHGLCFFASVAVSITPPYLGEYRASTSSTLSGALAASLAAASGL